MKRSILVVTATAVLMLAGGAFAAGRSPASEIKNSTITGKDVKNKSLTRKDFRGSVRGPRGFTGPQGPQGPQGRRDPRAPPARRPGPSALGQIVRVENTVTVLAGDLDAATATCPAGHGLVSGGFSFIAEDGEVFFEDDFGSGNSWSVGGDNFDSAAEGELTAIAYCSPSGAAVRRARNSRRRRGPARSSRASAPPTRRRRGRGRSTPAPPVHPVDRRAALGHGSGTTRLSARRRSLRRQGALLRDPGAVSVRILARQPRSPIANWVSTAAIRSANSW